MESHHGSLTFDKYADHTTFEMSLPKSQSMDFEKAA
jgi:nitrogen-specific signal transduction histidine kinase